MTNNGKKKRRTFLPYEAINSRNQRNGDEHRSLLSGLRGASKRVEWISSPLIHYTISWETNRFWITNREEMASFDGIRSGRRRLGEPAGRAQKRDPPTGEWPLPYASGRMQRWRRPLSRRCGAAEEGVVDAERRCGCGGEGGEEGR